MSYATSAFTAYRVDEITSFQQTFHGSETLLKGLRKECTTGSDIQGRALRIRRLSPAICNCSWCCRWNFSSPWYNGMLPRMARPQRILSTQMLTVPIEEDGIQKNVSTDRITLSHTREQVTNKLFGTMQIKRPPKENQQLQSTLKHAKKVTREDTFVPQEHVFICIMRHIHTTQEQRM